MQEMAKIILAAMLNRGLDSFIHNPNSEHAKMNYDKIIETYNNILSGLRDAATERKNKGLPADMPE